MRLAQCGSMEAKALSFVLRAAGSEHHMSSTRRMFTYVVGGRVGMNDTCYFTLDMKKLDHTIPLPSMFVRLRAFDVHKWHMLMQWQGANCGGDGSCKFAAGSTAWLSVRNTLIF